MIKWLLMNQCWKTDRVKRFIRNRLTETYNNNIRIHEQAGEKKSENFSSKLYMEEYFKRIHRLQPNPASHLKNHH